MPSTISRSDIYPNKNGFAPSTQVASGDPETKSGNIMSPAYAWAMILALLVILRFLWERGGK
jgi:hypothetical protein